jgi:hypothetical protein
MKAGHSWFAITARFHGEVRGHKTSTGLRCKMVWLVRPRPRRIFAKKKSILFSLKRNHPRPFRSKGGVGKRLPKKIKKPAGAKSPRRTLATTSRNNRTHALAKSSTKTHPFSHLEIG